MIQTAHFRFLGLVILIGLVGACSNKAETPAPAAQPAAQGSAAPAAQSGQTITGTVAETMDAASYTYLRVKTDSGDAWVATGQVKVNVGDKVTVPVEMRQTDFHSPSLKRDFPVIYFASHIERNGQPVGPGAGQPTAASGGQPGAAMMSAHGSTADAPAGNAPVTVTEKIEPPAGGMSIADVWAKRATLVGKTVTVRGKVVKFNGGIMDRNWLHLQDGSGNAKDGSNDLTITTQDAAKLGDVVTASGKLAVDKDFGAGYSYRAILESATVK